MLPDVFIRCSRRRNQNVQRIRPTRGVRLFNFGTKTTIDEKSTMLRSSCRLLIENRSLSNNANRIGNFALSPNFRGYIINFDINLSIRQTVFFAATTEYEHFLCTIVSRDPSGVASSFVSSVIRGRGLNEVVTLFSKCR